jgi:hypothetical protein
VCVILLQKTRSKTPLMYEHDMTHMTHKTIFIKGLYDGLVLASCDTREYMKYELNSSSEPEEIYHYFWHKTFVLCDILFMGNMTETSLP